MAPPKNTIGRLALRVEGDLWVAYYAQVGTMDDAIFLGSILMAFVQDDVRKNVFMELMKQSIEDMMRDQLGDELTWPEPQSAPEHERGGNA